MATATATTLAELQLQIRTRYDSLSKRLQQVARYVLENENSIALDTVASIAKKANVPPSTLIRFAQAFNYNGLNDMKLLFRDNLIEGKQNYTERVELVNRLEDEPLNKPEDILKEFALANSQAMKALASQTPTDTLNQAVDLLVNADSIYIIGLRRSFGVASYLTYALRHLQRRVILIDGLGGMYQEQVSMLNKNDVVVSISFSPYSADTLKITETASSVGAQQITITDSFVSPLASLSDCCFVVKEAKVDNFRSLSSSMCLVQALAVSVAFNSENSKPENI